MKNWKEDKEAKKINGGQNKYYYWKNKSGSRIYEPIPDDLALFLKKEVVDKIRKSKVWELVPNTPRKIMIGDKELDKLLKEATK